MLDGLGKHLTEGTAEGPTCNVPDTHIRDMALRPVSMAHEKNKKNKSGCTDTKDTHEQPILLIEDENIL